MPERRPDLDGERLVDLATSQIWVMFHGERHLVASDDVYNNLFSERERLVTAVDVNTVERGADLEAGTCIVRPEGSGNIYLVTGSGGDVRRHYVTSFECLCDFGFDIGKTRNVPEILVRTVREGEALTSASSRAE